MLQLFGLRHLNDSEREGFPAGNPPHYAPFGSDTLQDIREVDIPLRGLDGIRADTCGEILRVLRHESVHHLTDERGTAEAHIRQVDAVDRGENLNDGSRSTVRKVDSVASHEGTHRLRMDGTRKIVRLRRTLPRLENLRLETREETNARLRDRIQHSRKPFGRNPEKRGRYPVPTTSAGTSYPPDPTYRHETRREGACGDTESRIGISEIAAANQGGKGGRHTTGDKGGTPRKFLTPKTLTGIPKYLQVEYSSTLLTKPHLPR